jgi:putative ABC transport system permease protein
LIIISHDIDFSKKSKTFYLFLYFKTRAPMKKIYFAARLAWKQLFYERSKTSTALLGVMFACVLVFMQLGFRDSLFRSAANLPRQLQGDIFVMHSQNNAIWQALPFSKSILARLYGHPAVANSSSVLMGQARWKNPENSDLATVLVLGIDPNASVISNFSDKENTALLNMRNTVIFDSLSKPEFGPIGQWLETQKTIPVEINNRQFRVVKTFQMGASFAATGNIVTSQSTFYNIFPEIPNSVTQIGVLNLKPGYSVQEIQQELQSLVSPSIVILRADELIDHEENYWRKRTSIGFTFGMGVIIGLIVGMVIVYQILFTDVMNRLSEYATLRAMGYSQRYLSCIVVSSALWLAILGFLPGVLAARGLYYLTESVTRLPMILSFGTIVSVWFLIFGMCAVAGLLAVRQLKNTDPAGLF